MVVGGGSTADGLEFCFKNLMVVDGKVNMAAAEAGMNGWKDLPTELLLRVLSITDDHRTVILAAGVCTGWRDAVSMGLTRLSLSWCSNNVNNLLLSLSPKFTKLQVLSLRQSKPQVQDNGIKTLATYCHDLRDLDLSKSLKLTDRSLYSLADGCTRLVSLNISGCSAFTDSALAYLTSFCRGLKMLNLCGCVRAASDRALQAISHNCAQLQSLNIGWCEDVSDDGVTCLARGCPDLRALDLCGCVRITDESVIALANGCLHLRSLGLYYCQNITDRAMYSLANSRRQIRQQHSRKSSRLSCHDEGLANLNISQCTALTPPAVQAVCNSFPALHTCPGKHSLIISGCLSLTTVHCACGVQARRAGLNPLSNHAY